MQLLLLNQINVTKLNLSMYCNMLHAGDKHQERLLQNIVILFWKTT